MTLKRFTTPLIAAVLVLGACEVEEDGAVDQAPAVDDAPAVDELAPDTADTLASTPGELMPINRSDVTGRAEATRDGDDLVVEVEAEGLEPGARYAAFLHEGRCAEGGPIRLPLGRITADEEGAGSVRLSVEPDRAPAGRELFVQVHAPDDQPVACADVDPGEPDS